MNNTMDPNPNFGSNYEDPYIEFNEKKFEKWKSECFGSTRVTNYKDYASSLKEVVEHLGFNCRAPIEVCFDLLIRWETAEQLRERAEIELKRISDLPSIDWFSARLEILKELSILSYKGHPIQNTKIVDTIDKASLYVKRLEIELEDMKNEITKLRNR